LEKWCFLEEITTYLKIEKSTPYKMTRQGKIRAVRVEPRKNNKAIIWFPYNQEVIHKVKLFQAEELRENIGKFSMMKI